MKKAVNRPNPEPDAVFVVERDLKLGYTITGQKGPAATKLAEAALDLLDAIGQPDPEGPKEYYRWIGPVGPGGHCVGVIVRLLDTGEARFEQAWFSLPKTQGLLAGAVRTLAVLSFVLIVGVIAGAFGYHVWRTPRLPAKPSGTTAAGGVLIEADTTRYIDELREAIQRGREEGKKLRGFLAQEGLAASVEKDVVDREPTVRIEVVKDWEEGRFKDARIHWNAVEVRNVLNLLDALERFDELGAHAPQPEKPEL